MLSFAIEDFLLVLESYNLTIWPFHIFTYLLVITAVYLSFWPTKNSSNIILATLSFLWLFIGIVFCFIYWAPSHIFGYIFGVCCVLQGLIFLYGMGKSDITISPRDTYHTLIGAIFILYAVIVYPILGCYLGHTYPKYFAVGLVPCPTTILTFGIYLVINTKISIKYFVIPLIISLGGMLAAYKGIYEDIGLVVVGILGTILILRRNAKA